jgi:signal transduction histidine kinase
MTSSTDRDAHVEAVARRLLDKASGWSAHALSTPQARARLDQIGRIAAADRPGTPAQLPDEPATPAEKALCRNLIDLLRRELLTGHGDAVPDLAAVLRRLEELRTSLEPEWHESLSSGLTGLDASDLVVEVAHDLRSPLTSIMFLAETLRKGQADRFNEIEREQLGIIYSAALNLAGIASDLIDLARGEVYPQTAASAVAPFSVAEMLDRVRGMVAPMAEERALDLVFITPRHDGRIGDSVALSRILLNLATNALKFTDSGHITVAAEERDGPRVEFSVTDTGRGMDEDTVAALFEPFRLGGSRSGFKFSGTGLGLSITRRILELMGSQLRVDSRPGAGSRFSFDLDLPLVDEG